MADNANQPQESTTDQTENNPPTKVEPNPTKDASKGEDAAESATPTQNTENDANNSVGDQETAPLKTTDKTQSQTSLDTSTLVGAEGGAAAADAEEDDKDEGEGEGDAPPLPEKKPLPNSQEDLSHNRNPSVHSHNSSSSSSSSSSEDDAGDVDQGETTRLLDMSTTSPDTQQPPAGDTIEVNMELPMSGPNEPPPPYPGGPLPGPDPYGTPAATGEQRVVVQVTGNCPKCQTGNLIESFSFCGICLAIWCFPCGLICLFCMRNKKCSHCGESF